MLKKPQFKFRCGDDKRKKQYENEEPKKKACWRRKSTRNKRINRNRNEKIRTILKSTAWSIPVFLSRYETYLQITCGAMFSVFAVGTLWAKKI